MSPSRFGCFAALGIRSFRFVAASLAIAASCCGEERPTLPNSVGMHLVSIPAGRFVMGSPADEPGRRERETQREVELAAFYLSQCEVTQTQYANVVGTNPSAFAKTGSRATQVAGVETDDFPVESVTWAQANEFCERLSALPEERQAGRRYRLPTEAEWEYACRAGTTGPFAFGADASKLGDYAWIAANSGDRPHAVGGKLLNPWGLHDLYGNVWEWCADEYAPDEGEAAGEAVGQTTLRILRGGGYASRIPARLRSAARNFDPADVGDADTGFRVVMEVVSRDE